jgi:hypothetical protein
MMPERRAAETNIDTSLRLWSDDVPLGPLVDGLGLPVSHLHVAGRPVAAEGRLSRHVAAVHYASVANTRGTNDPHSWCIAVLEKVGAQSQLVSLLRQDRVEATLWIAVFGSEPVDPPDVTDDVLALARNLHVSVFIENYTRLGSGNAEKTWLYRPQSVHHVAG